MANNVDRDLAMALLVTAVANDPKGKAGVADKVGYGRSLISRVLSPNDSASLSDGLARRVIDVYHVIPTCPATGTTQPRSECMRLSQGKAPMHNPGAMRVWKTCQTCPHQPVSKGSNQ